MLKQSLGRLAISVLNLDSVIGKYLTNPGHNVILSYFSYRTLDPNIVRTIIKRCCALPLLDPKQLAVAFEGILVLAEAMDDEDPNKRLIGEFLEYILSTWIGSEDQVPL